MNDMKKGNIPIRAIIISLHHDFPNVDKQSLMKVIMILFRGSVNPVQVEQTIDEVFNAN